MYKNPLESLDDQEKNPVTKKKSFDQRKNSCDQGPLLYQWIGLALEIPDLTRSHGRLKPKPQTLNPKQTLNPQPSIMNPKPSALNLEP